MDAGAMIDLIRADSAALAAAAAAAPEAAIGSCPEWDMAALVNHVGVVHRWAATIIRTGERARHGDVERPGPGTPMPSLVEWLGAATAELCSALSASDPAREVWTFSPAGEQNVRWWIRRQACETAIHRWDAEHAATRSPAPVDPAIAVGGIDEFLDEFLAGLLDRTGVELGGTLHLHATDTDGAEWLVDFTGSAPKVERAHAKADTALRGPVSDLLLWLWNRLAVGGARLEVFGSPDPVVAWPRLAI